MLACLIPIGIAQARAMDKASYKLYYQIILGIKIIIMTNITRSNFQDHPFHLVSPSPWPLYTSISLFTLTVNAALSMHLFSNSYIMFYISLSLVIASMTLWFRDIISEGTFLGNHTLAVQKGLNLGIILFIVSEALFFLAIFWAFFHKHLWIGAKLRGSPKALITKLLVEKLVVASLMIEGIVTSLEIFDIVQIMGDRGSKSDSHISVKEQRADGSSIFYKYCKVCSKCQGNLVFFHSIKNVNSIYYKNTNFNISYLNIQKSFYSSQIRLLNSETNKLNPNYVTGFTDGEGCFFVGVNLNPRYKTGYRVKIIFQIGVHEKDLALLEQIKLFFGVGEISRLGEESIQFRVSSLNDLNIIINHFDNYPLLTRKLSDYLLFKQVLSLMEQGKHLTLEGLNQIVSIKASLNNGELSDTLKSAFLDIKPASKPEIKDRKIKDLHWLAGFTDAEGCFFVALKKSPGSKLGETVWLRFILTQHSRDQEFLESLISTLNCGRYIPKSGYGEFIVEKFSDVRNKIIPIFEEYKLHGIKLKNYEDFKKAAFLMENKAHLTREGLDEIKKIKGGMNKNRI